MTGHEPGTEPAEPVVTLRPAIVADAEDVASIYVASWNAGFGHLLGRRDLHRGEVDRWRADLAGVTATWTVAEWDGAIAGFIGVGPARDPVDAELGEVDTIAVSPPQWRRGIGRALMARGVEQLEQRWPRAVLWTPDAYERGHAFYTATGWHRLALTRDSGRQVAFGRGSPTTPAPAGAPPRPPHRS